MSRTTILAAALCVLSVAAAGAAPPARGVVRDRPWPATQANLGLEADGFDSWASAKAVLPPHLVVAPPAAKTPAGIKEYSGLWSGWMCRNRDTDLKVAFTKVAAKQATATIAWAGGGAAPGHLTQRLALVGDEFRFDTGEVSYKFHLRTFDERVGVETMDVLTIRGDGTWCSGVLRKDAAR